MNDKNRTALVQLWILRILLHGNAFRQFVRETDFRDDDVAYVVGLSHWIQKGLKSGDRPAIKAELEECLKALEEAQVRFSPRVSENFKAFARIAGLSRAQTTVIEFLVVMDDEPVLGDTLRLMDHLDRYALEKIIASALAMPARSIAAALDPAGALARSGFLRWDKCSRTGARLEFSVKGVGQHLLYERFSLEEVIRQVVRPVSAPDLAASDYSHLGANWRDMRSHLQLALREQRPGVNIFIYGPPGTGKSQLTRVMARSLRCRAFEVSSEDREGDPRSGYRRMEALRMAGVLLRKQRAFLVFDEAEDVFRSRGFFDRSPADNHKAWINRTLETNALPTVWISNQAAMLDRAFVRRFDLVLELTAPPPLERRRIYRRICGRASTPVIDALADYEAVSPAIVKRAATVTEAVYRGASTTDRDNALLRIVRNTLHAQGHDASRIEGFATSEFDSRYFNSYPPMPELTAFIGKGIDCRICLYGPPGTGKSCFGRWIANQSGRPLHARTASDVLGPHVGETEEKIAQVFNAARREDAVLMIDEVDSLLADRSHAVRSWEVTQVNEPLTQLERFSGIFIASTNRISAVDEAALRRFDLKLKLDFLTPYQSVELLTGTCDTIGLGQPDQEATRTISGLSNLTPGDFANAARQHRFQRFHDPADFAKAVARECACKRSSGQRIGFS